MPVCALMSDGLFALPPSLGSRRSLADARPQQGVLPPRGRDIRLSRPGLRVRRRTRSKARRVTPTSAALFPGREYVGCDMRPGPGRGSRRGRDGDPPARSTRPARCSASRRSSTSSRSAGRSTKSFASSSPAGVFVITSPLNFRIHGYPDDYWRMTPSCLRRMLEPYAARVSGFQGYQAFPHTVMGVGIKAPVPADCDRDGVEAGRGLSTTGLEQTEAALPARREAATAGLPALSVQRRAAPDRRLLRGRASRSTSRRRRSRERDRESPIHTAA